MENTNKLVKFEEEAFLDFSDLMSNYSFSKVIFLVDENTNECCLVPLLQELDFISEYEVLEIEAGEENKSPEVLFQLWHALSDLKTDRKSLLVNVGGGVVSDLGGFLASTYMRGIQFVNFPTSLLAQVDASVGGKNGINLDHLKNRVGVFQNPVKTYVLNGFLHSLPERERRSGFAEMLKHGLIADKAIWSKLKSFDIENQIPSFEMVQHSVNIKNTIVEQDFKESGLRKALNFGHTIGHAIEAAALDNNESILHGEAIALGMIMETVLSVKHCQLAQESADDICENIHRIFHDVRPVGTAESWMNYIYEDKKNINSELRFTLLKDIGDFQVDVNVKVEDVMQVLKQYV